MKEPTELSVPLDGGAVTALVYPGDAPPRSAPAATLVLAHGAGADQRSAFMIGFARALSALGLDVVTFNFPYTERKGRLPDRGPVLEGCYGAVIERVRARVASATRGLFIGGKSMGGRIATQVAASDPGRQLAGLVLLGYPLHPPGRPGQRRDAHLPSIRRPVLFVQGSRDAFGTPAELQEAIAAMSPPPALHVVEGGDHSFKVPRQGEQSRVHDAVQRAIVAWISSVSGAPS